MVAGVLYSEFTNFTKIGEGMLSRVFRVRHIRDNKEYALKKSHISINKKNLLEVFNREVQILSDLEHQNIVRYYTSFIDDQSHFCILMEFCGKDLENCFESQPDMDNLLKPQAVEIFSDIICGLEYIHGKNMIHRDLKPSNIFLCPREKNCYAKIGDFGLACYNDHSLTINSGILLYQAPEQNSSSYDCKVDMYSAGLIFFELLTLRKCSSSVVWKTVLKSLRSDVKNMLKRYERFLPEPAKKMISVLLRESPKKRASAMEIRQELRKQNASKSKPNIFGSPEKGVGKQLHQLEEAACASIPVNRERSGQDGYIPCNYVAPKESFEAER